MNPEPGLRERKRQRTREAIARAAHQLFVERGYEATTLPDIAEAADVSTRTIFAYFPSKEDILFCDFAPMKEALGRALAERPEGQDTLETVRTFIVRSHPAEKSELKEGLNRIIQNDATLRTHMRARFAELEELIAAAIAEDLGAAETDLRPQVVASSLIAAFDVLMERGERPTPKQSPEEIAAQIDPVMSFLRGGLEALKEPKRLRRTARR